MAKVSLKNIAKEAWIEALGNALLKYKMIKGNTREAINEEVIKIGDDEVLNVSVETEEDRQALVTFLVRRKLNTSQKIEVVKPKRHK